VNIQKPLALIQQQLHRAANETNTEICRNTIVVDVLSIMYNI